MEGFSVGSMVLDIGSNRVGKVVCAPPSKSALPYWIEFADGCFPSSSRIKAELIRAAPSASKPVTKISEAAPKDIGSSSNPAKPPGGISGMLSARSNVSLGEGKRKSGSMDRYEKIAAANVVKHQEMGVSKRDIANEAAPDRATKSGSMDRYEKIAAANVVKHQEMGVPKRDMPNEAAPDRATRSGSMDRYEKIAAKNVIKHQEMGVPKKDASSGLSVAQKSSLASKMAELRKAPAASATGAAATPRSPIIGQALFGSSPQSPSTAFREIIQMTVPEVSASEAKVTPRSPSMAFREAMAKEVPDTSSSLPIDNSIPTTQSTTVQTAVQKKEPDPCIPDTKVVASATKTPEARILELEAQVQNLEVQAARASKLAGEREARIAELLAFQNFKEQDIPTPKLNGDASHDVGQLEKSSAYMQQRLCVLEDLASSSFNGQLLRMEKRLDTVEQLACEDEDLGMMERKWTEADTLSQQLLQRVASLEYVFSSLSDAPVDPTQENRRRHFASNMARTERFCAEVDGLAKQLVDRVGSLERLLDYRAQSQGEYGKGYEQPPPKAE